MRKIVNKINSILRECSAKIPMYEKYIEGGYDYNEEIERNRIIMDALRLLLKETQKQVMKIEGVSTNNNDESSEDKQRRLNCYVGNGVNNWSCYEDCAFWQNEICTNFNGTSKREVRILDARDKNMLDILVEDKGERYQVIVDNDSAWVEDKERDNEPIYNFQEYGYELALILLQYMGIKAEMC